MGKLSVDLVSIEWRWPWSWNLQAGIYRPSHPIYSKGLISFRPDYLDALLPLIDPQITHFNKRCISVSHVTSGKHILRFEDGTTHQANLIIGADGIKSVTRNFVTDDHEAKNLIFTNNVAYRGLIPVDKLKRAGVTINLTSRPLCWVGIDKVSYIFRHDD